MLDDLPFTVWYLRLLLQDIAGFHGLTLISDVEKFKCKSEFYFQDSPIRVKAFNLIPYRTRRKIIPKQRRKINSRKRQNRKMSKTGSFNVRYACENSTIPRNLLLITRNVKSQCQVKCNHSLLHPEPSLLHPVAHQSTS